MAGTEKMRITFFLFRLSQKVSELKKHNTREEMFRPNFTPENNPIFAKFENLYYS